MNRKKSITGFTLVELLVVIAIIGILVAMLLPAINSAREASRRTKCINNLKQLTLAVNSYSEANKKFPPGKMVNSSGNCDNTPDGYTNWAIEVLPFLEESWLYARYRQDLENADALNKPVITQFISWMMCPSDPNGSRIGDPANGPGNEFASGSYKAVAGRGVFTSSNVNNYFDSVRSRSGQIFLKDRGPLFVIIKNPSAVSSSCVIATMNRGPIKIKQITDGISKTLLVGEYTTTSALGRAGYWANTYYGMNMGSIHVPGAGAPSTNATLDADYDACTKAMGNNEEACKRTFAGIHTAGAINFAFCDGSVKTFQNDMNMNVLSNLATTAGGEINAVD